MITKEIKEDIKYLVDKELDTIDDYVIKCINSLDSLSGLRSKEATIFATIGTVKEVLKDNFSVSDLMPEDYDYEKYIKGAVQHIAFVIIMQIYINLIKDEYDRKEKEYARQDKSKES